MWLFLLVGIWFLVVGLVFLGLTCTLVYERRVFTALISVIFLVLSVCCVFLAGTIHCEETNGILPYVTGVSDEAHDTSYAVMIESWNKYGEVSDIFRMGDIRYGAPIVLPFFPQDLDRTRNNVLQTDTENISVQSCEDRILNIICWDYGVTPIICDNWREFVNNPHYIDQEVNNP